MATDDPSYPHPPPLQIHQPLLSPSPQQPSGSQVEFFPVSAAIDHLGAGSTAEAMERAERFEYELVVRQEPKQARMCGVGGKADRRPIDPPPIVQLRVIDKRKGGSEPQTPQMPMLMDDEDGEPSYLQNPYYFMFASLAKPDDEVELHWLKDGRTRCTTGSVVSSLYHLKDPHSSPHPNADAGFFVFPDLSVRTEGSYRLKLSLYEVLGADVRHCKSIYSTPFYVYTAKKFPGMEESTPLSCSLADQGIKIRIRKDVRVRKRPMHGLEAPLLSTVPVDGSGGAAAHHQQQQQLQESEAYQPKRKKPRLDDPAGEQQSSSATTEAAAIPPPPGATHGGQQQAYGWGTPPANSGAAAPHAPPGPGPYAPVPGTHSLAPAPLASAMPPPGVMWPPAAALDPSLTPQIPPPAGASRETVPPDGQGAGENSKRGKKRKNKDREAEKVAQGRKERERDRDSERSSETGGERSQRETPAPATATTSSTTSPTAPTSSEYQAQTQQQSQQPPPPPYAGSAPSSSSAAAPPVPNGYGHPPPPGHTHAHGPPPHPYMHPGYPPYPPPHAMPHPHPHAYPPPSVPPPPHWGIPGTYPDPYAYYGYRYPTDYPPQSAPPPPAGYPPYAYPQPYGWGIPPPPPPQGWAPPRPDGGQHQHPPPQQDDRRDTSATNPRASWPAYYQQPPPAAGAPDGRPNVDWGTPPTNPGPTSWQPSATSPTTAPGEPSASSSAAAAGGIKLAPLRLADEDDRSDNGETSQQPSISRIGKEREKRKSVPGLTSPVDQPGAPRGREELSIGRLAE